MIDSFCLTSGCVFYIIGAKVVKGKGKRWKFKNKKLQDVVQATSWSSPLMVKEGSLDPQVGQVHCQTIPRFSPTCQDQISFQEGGDGRMAKDGFHERISFVKHCRGSARFTRPPVARVRSKFGKT